MLAHGSFHFTFLFSISQTVTLFAVYSKQRSIRNPYLSNKWGGSYSTTKLQQAKKCSKLKFHLQTQCSSVKGFLRQISRFHPHG